MLNRLERKTDWANWHLYGRLARERENFGRAGDSNGFKTLFCLFELVFVSVIFATLVETQ